MNIPTDALPPEQRAPTGYCMRLVNIREGKEYCEELSWFWPGAGDPWDNARNEVKYLLSDPPPDLSEGEYRAVIYPAWKGNEIEPADYADTDPLEITRFVIKRVTVVEVL